MQVPPPTFPPAEGVIFNPTRQAGLARLSAFAPQTGQHYASQRNYDFGPENRSTVSVLSPWIKHRLITEEEVLTQTLAHHSLSSSMKFVQEVFWRGYFKGWLEQHPSVWLTYQRGVTAGFAQLGQNEALKRDYTEAIDGRTGIACFDAWCGELKSTGYLHNHSRMWFASIWIFTLRLPWELGAHFFMCHLIDRDAAANTLSWRWVGGLHTKGKIYLADPANIAECTGGRFEPIGQLAQTANPLEEEVEHPLVPLPTPTQIPEFEYLHLITPEDCQADKWISGNSVGALGLMPSPDANQSAQIHAFQHSAVKDAVARCSRDAAIAKVSKTWADDMIHAAESAGIRHIVTSRAAIGPIATELSRAEDTLRAAGIKLYQVQRRYDRTVWPHASKGFFKLKKQIPKMLSELEIAQPHS
ncbi:FAD-binding domain-containing protein [Planktotalea sp.]|uniref:FAD-binding domain-containing protein n=1 Tax=Planktotalea sp. TaxID=2029877 RepID=UPI00329A3F95